jgi:hypothetical protein
MNWHTLRTVTDLKSPVGNKYHTMPGKHRTLDIGLPKVGTGASEQVSSVDQLRPLCTMFPDQIHGAK